MKRVLSQIDSMAIWICLALLGIGIVFGEVGPGRDAGIEAARIRIQEALASVPDAIGKGREWIKLSDDLVPPTQASMLGLNAYLSCSYQRLGDAPVRRAKLFIANSVDARSMLGHHPPNCYPKSGYEVDHEAERSIEVGTSIGTRIPARVYRFRASTNERISLIVVSGFLMPDGRAVATLEETRELSSRAATSRLGLSQFQIVFAEDLTASDVDRYAQEILGGIPEEVYLAIGGVVDGLEDARQGDDS